MAIRTGSASRTGLRSPRLPRRDPRGDRAGARERHGARDRLDGRLQGRRRGARSSAPEQPHRRRGVERRNEVGALIGLGIEGEDGLAPGAEAGAEMGTEGAVLTHEKAMGCPRGHPAGLGRRAHPDRAPVGSTPARRDLRARWLPDRRRVHQPARPRRDRLDDGRRGTAAPRDVDVPRRGHQGRCGHRIREAEMVGVRRVARRTSRRTARRR